MCRLVAYLGSDILLEDVVVKPVNSIVMQSLHARESTIPTNGDGFGLGWYAPEINPFPALFVSIFPAWNDNNLLHLTAKIKSPCFFAHVRAASVGGINPYNCHPFIYKQWMLMHNGHIQDFVAVKRHLRRLLDDDIYNWIQGETDSEHLFALFLQLSKGKDLTNLAVVVEVLEATLYEIELLVKQYGKPGPSFYNICLTDGERMVASRYCTDKALQPESLHYLAGQFVTSEDDYQHDRQSPIPECVMIASEKLTDFHGQWHLVPANHFLSVDNERRVKLYPVSI
ncbi:MAG: class II glutamine amidotransferase [Legionella sp.]|nr:class II glutamine amidotransferase [Legionella sp.]